MTKNERQQNWIKKAKSIHGNKYDYSKVDYVNTNTNVTIICPEHGEFQQRPSEHLKSKVPCPICGGRIINSQIFIEKARKVHEDKYDYSKIGETKSSKDKVIIICPIHGEFSQEVNSHLQGRGCAKCSGRKFCLEDYINKANLVWNNKYNYSKFEWNGVNEKVCIICPEHGEFWQLPNNHLKGECGCLECRGKSKDFKPITCLEDVIEFSKNNFNDKFDFSKAVWKGSREKIEIICPDHGSFWTLPRQFTLNKYGCPDCNDLKKYTNEEFINLCKRYHSEYDYDYSKVNYIKSSDPITVICKKHGEFYPNASQFVSGKCNCPKCVIDSFRLGTEEFIKRAKEIHGDRYDYSKVNYVNYSTNVTIICPIHGEFEQIAGNHLKGCNCPICSRENIAPTHGEELIAKFLEENNIKYKFQYEITTKKIARNSNIIRVDFAISRNKHVYFIEYNGKQHYEYIPFFHKGGMIDFEKQQRRDNLLREICKLYEDRITLIEIPYYMKENEIKETLTRVLNL